MDKSGKTLAYLTRLPPVKALRQANAPAIFAGVVSVGTLATLAVLFLTLTAPVPGGANRTDEAQAIGLVVVLVSFLVALLFVMTVAFSGLGLTDKGQALGLPEGSIRALVALMLLLMFAFLSVFLFLQVTAVRTQTVPNLTAAQLTALGDRVYSAVPNGSNFDVRIVLPVQEAVERFAQQIFTAALTLVTAVSSFYFAQRGPQASPPTAGLGPAITKVTPDMAQTGTKITVDIEGTGFATPAMTQRRRRSNPPIDGTQVQVLDTTKIRCQFDLTGAAVGDWSVVVRNPGGLEAAREAGFTIT